MSIAPGLRLRGTPGFTDPLSCLRTLSGELIGLGVLLHVDLQILIGTSSFSMHHLLFIYTGALLYLELSRVARDRELALDFPCVPTALADSPGLSPSQKWANHIRIIVFTLTMGHLHFRSPFPNELIPVTTTF